MAWAKGDERKRYQVEREQWMHDHWYEVTQSSVLFRDNLDHCYEVIRTRAMLWEIYLWAYTIMNVNEFLMPFIAVNSDGMRTIRPNKGESHRGLIGSRLRLLYSNALGINKFRYVAYKNMPSQVVKDGVYHICIEGFLEALQKRDRLNPEALYICQHMGVRLNKKYKTRYTRVIVNTINGHLTDRKK